MGTFYAKFGTTYYDLWSNNGYAIEMGRDTQYPSSGKVFSSTDSYHPTYTIPNYYTSRTDNVPNSKAVKMNDWEVGAYPSDFGYDSTNDVELVRYGSKLSSSRWTAGQSYGPGTYYIYLGDDDCFYIIKSDSSSGTRISGGDQGVIGFALCAGGGGGGGNPSSAADGAAGGGGSTAFGVLNLRLMRENINHGGSAYQYKVEVGSGGGGGYNSSGSSGGNSTITLMENMTTSIGTLVYAYGGSGGPQNGTGGAAGGNPKIYTIYKKNMTVGSAAYVGIFSGFVYPFKPATPATSGTSVLKSTYYYQTNTAGKGGNGYTSGGNGGSSGESVSKTFYWSGDSYGGTTFSHNGGGAGDQGRPGGGGASCFGNGGGGGAVASNGSPGGTGAGGGGGRWTLFSFKSGGRGGDGVFKLYGCDQNS